MTPEFIASALQLLGVTGLLAVALIAFYKGWIYTGSAYRALEKDRDRWQEMALTGLKTAADMATAAKTHTSLTPEEAEVARKLIREAGQQ